MRGDPLAQRRTSFRSVTADYDRNRPRYPVTAIEWLLGARRSEIVDLGCGPGKLTSQLAEMGHGVIGIDPSEKMLQGMTSRGLRAVCGTAEAIPLKTGSAEVVTAAQAFHWFDHPRAVPEMRRILRPGGRVGLVWNLRDETVDWVRGLSEIIGSEDAAPTLEGSQNFEDEVAAKLGYDDSFGSIEHEVFAFEQELTEEGLVGLVRSRSYVAILPSDEQREILREVRRLCREHPQLGGHQSFRLPYRTRAFRARARS